MITRCERNRTMDGVKAGVRHIAADAYCFGGKRLVAISGVNGMGGTEYRVVSDDFTKVISIGSTTVTLPNGQVVPGGPVSFKVYTRDGRSMEFGTTAISQLRQPDSPLVNDGDALGRNPIRAWALKKVFDQNGNYILYEYNNNFTPSVEPTSSSGFFTR